MIDTSRSPYVVKNPSYGTPGGGPVEAEVPWREGTSVRSARRSDLLRVLVPVAAMPTVEILDGEVKLRQAGNVGQRYYALRLDRTCACHRFSVR